jgi:hypothetical protein
VPSFCCSLFVDIHLLELLARIRCGGINQFPHASVCEFWIFPLAVCDLVCGRRRIRVREKFLSHCNIYRCHWHSLWLCVCLCVGWAEVRHFNIDYRSAVAPSTKRSTIGPKRSAIFDGGLYVLFLRRNHRILVAPELSHRVMNCSKQTYRARWGHHLSRCNYQTMLVDSFVGRPQVVQVTAGNRSSITVPSCIQTSVMLI